MVDAGTPFHMNFRYNPSGGGPDAAVGLLNAVKTGINDDKEE